MLFCRRAIIRWILLDTQIEENNKLNQSQSGCCSSATELVGLPHMKRLTPITTYLSARNHTLYNIQKQFIVLSSGMFIKLSWTSRDSIIMLSRPQKDCWTCVYSFCETLGVADIGVGKVELPEIKLVTWQEKIQGRLRA